MGVEAEEGGGVGGILLILHKKPDWGGIVERRGSWEKQEKEEVTVYQGNTISDRMYEGEEQYLMGTGRY